MSRVFVFGSNVVGVHGAGSAKEAMKHGAVRGIGEGRQGNSYAIPTKFTWRDYGMALGQLRRYVDRFIHHAHTHPEDYFVVVEIGCGLAGYTPEQIAPMFADAPPNVHLPAAFVAVLEKVAK